MSADSVNVALMKAMGSKSGEWDPIPPQQYERFEGMTNSEDLRLWAAILKRTIGRANDQTRSPFCREANGRITQQTNLAADLGMSPANVSSALKRLEADGRIRRSEGKIWLRADVPAPDLTEEANKQQTEVICLENISTAEIDYLQRLQAHDAKAFRVAVARLLAHEEWYSMVAAEAQAWARNVGAAIKEQILTEAGYTKTEKRGRKKERSFEPGDTFKLPTKFSTFSIQKTSDFEAMAEKFSIQNGKLIFTENHSDSVQKPYPYGPEVQSSESQLAADEKVDAKAKTSKAELKREQVNAEVKNEIKIEIRTRLQRAKLTALGAVQMDAGTLNTLAADMARLKTAGEVREVLDVLEERARELRTGARVADGWGYLVKTVRGEVEKRLPADLKSQIKTTAAGKAMR